MLTTVAAALLLLIVLAAAVTVVDATRSAHWRVVAVERRRTWREQCEDEVVG